MIVSLDTSWSSLSWLLLLGMLGGVLAKLKQLFCPTALHWSQLAAACFASLQPYQHFPSALYRACFQIETPKPLSLPVNLGRYSDMFRYLAAQREDHSASAMFEGSSSWLRIGKTTFYWEDDSCKHWSWLNAVILESTNVPYCAFDQHMFPFRKCTNILYLIAYKVMKGMGQLHAKWRNQRT